MTLIIPPEERLGAVLLGGALSSCYCSRAGFYLLTLLSVVRCTHRDNDENPQRGGVLSVYEHQRKHAS